MQHDMLEIHVQYTGNLGRKTERVLGARPQFADIVVNPRRAIHRLHRCVRKVGHAILGFDGACSGCHRRIDVTRYEVDDLVASCDRAIHVGGELLEYVTLLDGFVAVLAEFHGKLVQRLPGRPVTVRDDGNCIVEIDDFAYARHVLHGRLVYGFHAGAKHGRCLHGGVFHARQLCVYAERRAAIDFGRHIQSLYVRAEDRELIRRLENRLYGLRQFGRLSREFCIRRFALAAFVNNVTLARRQFCERDAPGVSRGL